MPNQTKPNQPDPTRPITHHTAPPHPSHPDLSHLRVSYRISSHSISLAYHPIHQFPSPLHRIPSYPCILSYPIPLQKLEDISNFLLMKRIPTELSSNILDFVEYQLKSSKSALHESGVDDLPPELGFRLMIELHKDVIKKCPLFTSLPPNILLPVLRDLKPMIFVPGQLVSSPHLTSPHLTSPHLTSPRHATPRHATPRHSTARHATPRPTYQSHCTGRA